MSDRYTKANILAPMVRIGRLPMRLLALNMGANLVYTEELIDQRILECRIEENKALGTVDFVHPDGDDIIFRTCAAEKSQLVFQLGAAEPELAFKAAKMVEPYVSGIDINMGCPKSFSVKTGRGAALLTKPDTIKAMLTTLVDNLSVYVTCKIRILPTIEETVELAKLIQSCGVVALAVHGRTKAERENHAVRCDYISAIADALDIPVIANGGSRQIIRCYDDLETFRKMCSPASSVMVARAALHNPSVFSASASFTKREMMISYLRLAIKYDNGFVNTKYTLQCMCSDTEPRTLNKLLPTKTLRQVCSVFGLEDVYDDFRNKTLHVADKAEETTTCHAEDPFSNAEIILVQFERCDFSGDVTPKVFLHQWLTERGFALPRYETVGLDPSGKKLPHNGKTGGRKFRSVCVLDVPGEIDFTERQQFKVTLTGKERIGRLNNVRRFTAPYNQTSRKRAEQLSALACCRALGIPFKSIT